MRKFLLTALAATAISTPAVARDGSFYAGVEGGIMSVLDADMEYQGLTGLEDGDLDVDHGLGIDLDAVVGYDLGLVRVEGELGWKRASIDETDVDIPNFGPLFDDGGRGRSVSAMANVLLDFGNEEGLSFYLGGGVGVARTSYKIDAISFGATDSNLAYQAIAGVRMPLSPNIDAGLKYRYFMSKYNVEESAAEEILGKWKSHSLLASLIFNFGAAEAAPPPPPPPPVEAPPPPPPATQTCPDGTVILATETCPAPPPPPPPPPPAPERG